MKPNLDREQRLFDALKRITAYQPPEKLRKSAETAYGLSAEEAIEYAYENVIHEAKNALKGMRRPVARYTQTELDAAAKRAGRLHAALRIE